MVKIVGLENAGVEFTGGHVFERFQDTQFCNSCKLLATASRRTPTTCGTADNSSSGEDEESDVQDQQNDTASTSATTDTDVSAPVDNCEVSFGVEGSAAVPRQKFTVGVSCGKTKMMGHQAIKSLMVTLAVSTQYTNVTDRRTDRLTYGHSTTAKTALHVA